MHGNTIEHDEFACGKSLASAGQPRDVFFSQACPICGRMLRIGVMLLGRRVYCQHCGGGFVAADETMRATSPRPDDAARSCDQTVDALLARAEAMLGRSTRSRRISR